MPLENCKNCQRESDCVSLHVLVYGFANVVSPYDYGSERID